MPCSRSLILLVALCLGVVAIAAAQPPGVADIPNPRSTHGGLVTDMAQVLGEEARQDIELRYEQLRLELGAEVALAIVPSIGSANPRQFTTALFQHWRVGREGVDDGVLVLHVLDQRRIEIETGYGVEAALPDAKCAWLIQDVAIPAFRAGAIARGHVALSAGIVRALRDEDIGHDALVSFAQAAGDAAPVNSGSQAQVATIASNPGYDLRPRIGMVCVVVAAIGYRLRVHRRYHRYHARYHPVPKVGIAFACLGLAFLFARWQGHWPWPGMAWLLVVSALTLLFTHRQRKRLQERYAARACEACARPMQLLEEAEANARLSGGARVEEALQAAEFDVWACACGAISRHELPGTCLVKRCPACQFRTSLQDRVIELEAATYDGPGLAELHYACAHCEHDFRALCEIPRLKASQSRGASSSSGSSGSSGSAGSSGSSSSFGGGSSGGGGAGGSY